MTFRMNRTEPYHVHQIESLGWEQTVCNAIEEDSNPIRRILRINDTYGNLLLDFLSPYLPAPQTVVRVLEVGGGYGYLMRDFLGRNPAWQATMLDLSPVLLERQKETLAPFSARFLCGDFLETSPDFLAMFELVVMNEILGDFPTACDVPAERPPGPQDSRLARVLELIRKFDLPIPSGETFNLNAGAIEAVDALCQAEVPFIFLSEHRCESRAPRD